MKQILSVRLIRRAVGIQPNTPLIPFLHARSNNRIPLLIQEDITKKTGFLM
jgi:hypothetical protein